MKSKIKLSAYSAAVSIIIIIVLVAACALSFNEKPVFYILLSLLIVLFAFALIYAPLAIKASPEKITIVSVLKKKAIPMRNVESVELFNPTLGSLRLCGSGGFMGYWGIFKEGDIGRYAAYYGKASDCFLIRMNNGDKYVLGCENPGAMVKYIELQIN